MEKKKKVIKFLDSALSANKKMSIEGGRYMDSNGKGCIRRRRPLSSSLLLSALYKKESTG